MDSGLLDGIFNLCSHIFERTDALVFSLPFIQILITQKQDKDPIREELAEEIAVPTAVEEVVYPEPIENTQTAQLAPETQAPSSAEDLKAAFDSVYEQFETESEKNDQMLEQLDRNVKFLESEYERTNNSGVSLLSGETKVQAELLGLEGERRAMHVGVYYERKNALEESKQLFLSANETHILAEQGLADGNKELADQLFTIAKEQYGTALERLSTLPHSEKIPEFERQYIANEQQALNKLGEASDRIGAALERTEKVHGYAKGALTLMSLATGPVGIAIAGIGNIGSNAIKETGHVALENKTAGEAALDFTVDSTIDGISLAAGPGGRVLAGSKLLAGSSKLAVAAPEIVGGSIEGGTELFTIATERVAGKHEGTLWQDTVDIATSTGFGALEGRTGHVIDAKVLGEGAGFVKQVIASTLDGVTTGGAVVAQGAVREELGGTGLSMEEGFVSAAQAVVGGKMAKHGGQHGADGSTHLTPDGNGARIDTTPRPEPAPVAHESSRWTDTRHDPVANVARKHIGDIGAEIRENDIIRRSEVDEIAPNQLNYARGSVEASLRVKDNVANGQETQVVYYEAKGLTAANSRLGHVEGGDRLVALENDVVQEYWKEKDPDALVFRGPNAAVVVKTGKYSAEEIASMHGEIETRLKERVSADPNLSDISDVHALRAGVSSVDNGAVLKLQSEREQALIAEGLTPNEAKERAEREAAQQGYYRALAEAGAAAEFEKKGNGGSVYTIDDVVNKGGYANAEEATIRNFNFIPPETSPGSLFNLHDQKVKTEAAMNNLLSAYGKSAETSDARRELVADILSTKPETPEQVKLHSEARQALVTYQAMAQRPGRFEANTQAVYNDTEVPIYNLENINEFETQLVDAGVPYRRADGDMDFLRNGFEADKQDLQSGKTALDEVLMNADARYGEFYTESAKRLKNLENEVNAGLAAEGKDPVYFYMGKQSTSDEFRVIVAGENSTPEMFDRALSAVRGGVEDVGMERPFEKRHKITGVLIEESGGTTTTLGTDYEFITNHEQRQAAGQRNDDIVELRKFIKTKNTSGDFNNLTPEEVQSIGQTMNEYLDFAEPVLEQNRRYLAGEPGVEPVANGLVGKAENAVKDLNHALSLYNNPDSVYGDVLGGHGLDTSEIRARAKAIAEHSNSSNTLTAEFAAPILPDIKDDPITTLYNNSVQSGKHHEGPEAMKAIVEDMQKLEAKGYERITPEQMTARISEFTAYGENVLNQMPEANAVVLHGSYLRGKPTAGDLDIRIAVEHSEPNPFDMDSAGYDTDSPTQASARSRYQEIGLPYSDGDIKSLVPVNGTIDGRPLQVHFDSHYSSGLDTGMGYAETSPYLAMVRQQDGTFALFYNNAGESYLRDGGKP